VARRDWACIGLQQQPDPARPTQHPRRADFPPVVEHAAASRVADTAAKTAAKPIAVIRMR